MILDLYLSKRQYGPICGSPRYIVRLARRLQRLHPDCRVVLSAEQDLTPSQVAVLGAIADANERACIDLLESGAVLEPVA